MEASNRKLIVITLPFAEHFMGIIDLIEVGVGAISDRLLCESYDFAR